jgi:hypothetical protein
MDDMPSIATVQTEYNNLDPLPASPIKGEGIEIEAGKSNQE